MGVAGAVMWFAMAIVEVSVLALLIDLLAPKFGGEKNRSQALKISMYSFTPALLGGALLIIPSLWLLVVLAALYGVYLLYLGLPQLMKSPPDRVAAYTVAVVACAIGVFLVVNRVAGAIVRVKGCNMAAAGQAHFRARPERLRVRPDRSCW